MALFLIGFILLLPIKISGSSNETIVLDPFYVRARMYDSHTATVQFEIGRETDQRTCEMYKFTIRHNRAVTYSMPEQNLTYWRNSLELKHLAAGKYHVCAIICSERLQQQFNRSKGYDNKTRAEPISTCVTFQASRSHFLVLTLYILVFIFLVFSHVTYSLRKRKIQDRIKMSLLELESSLQKWRASQAAHVSTDQTHSYHILQSLINLPAVPIEQAQLSRLECDGQIEHPVLFHLAACDQRQPSI
ncbi:unnamed protein product [Rotaria socialis]|uniref:Uncharacterized protein n=2 Tax=Rotaria socialis TaxID=392032 RepID=A0A818A7G2_9BILA|nr:unnamed protein product [Rotaria socialis]CAF3400275.1 unnamed protein product [Rotaria socialis]CAF3418625.1 unnamed protein product [Rotaria socialis]CAF4304783.1 unnamed protein product [Rotaria socialis]CAF4412275.1 unnamed protein product [Rotaria socialis]